MATTDDRTDHATHTCPCGCPARIPNRMLACRPGWNSLSRGLQRRVLATAHLSIIDDRRADVLADVMSEFAALNGRREGTGPRRAPREPAVGGPPPHTEVR